MATLIDVWMVCGTFIMTLCGVLGPWGGKITPWNRVCVVGTGNACYKWCYGAVLVIFWIS